MNVRSSRCATAPSSTRRRLRRCWESRPPGCGCASPGSWGAFKGTSTMSELDPFETRFAIAYRRYLAEAPVEADPVAVARRVAAAAPRRLGLAGFRPFGLTPAMAWVLLLAGLLLALVMGGLVVG